MTMAELVLSLCLSVSISMACGNRRALALSLPADKYQIRRRAVQKINNTKGKNDD